MPDVRITRLALAALPVLAAVALSGCGGGGGHPKGAPALVFVSTRDGDYAIFGADADAKGAYRLTKEKGDPSTPAGLFFQVDPAWSPDGRRIAFASRRDGTDHIYVMRADGTGARRITDSRQTDLHPSWSPDGRRIVFAREGALFVVPAAGGKARRVGHGLGNAADPAWSPDGKLIAYDYRQPGFTSREIWVMGSDGTHIRALTSFGRLSASPAWSPDGRRIAFHSDRDGTTNQIYSIGANGKGLRQLTHSTVDVFEPAWSPDGLRLVFAGGGALWLESAGQQTQLTSTDDNDASPAMNPKPGGGRK